MRAGLKETRASKAGPADSIERDRPRLDQCPKLRAYCGCLDNIDPKRQIGLVKRFIQRAAQAGPQRRPENQQIKIGKRFCRTPPPRVGEQSREVLTDWLGLEASELDALETAGVLA